MVTLTYHVFVHMTGVCLVFLKLLIHSISSGICKSRLLHNASFHSCASSTRPASSNKRMDRPHERLIRWFKKKTKNKKTQVCLFCCGGTQPLKLFSSSFFLDITYTADCAAFEYSLMFGVGLNCDRFQIWCFRY